MPKFKYIRKDKPLPQECDVIVERADCGSIGICIPEDHGELMYFSRTEARMIAMAILSVIQEGRS